MVAAQTAFAQSVTLWVQSLGGMAQLAEGGQRKGEYKSTLEFLVREVLRQGLREYCDLTLTCNSVDQLHRKIGGEWLASKVEGPKARRARIRKHLQAINEDPKWAQQQPSEADTQESVSTSCDSAGSLGIVSLSQSSLSTPRRVKFITPGTTVSVVGLPHNMFSALNGRCGLVKAVAGGGAGRILVQFEHLGDEPVSLRVENLEIQE
eukprot:Rhum_TRINITY_DN15211_c1_g1::Rhum_TRINITY_DN15211_c1_g1_i1::g.144939::m.144939